MAKKGPRVTIKLESESGNHTYFSQKNTRNTTEKLKLSKYNPVSRKHEIYTEGKMK
jgi:large subunit ribosomal protein L33